MTAFVWNLLRRPAALLAFLLLAGLLGGLALSNSAGQAQTGGTFSLERNVIAGGGQVASTGGGYSLGGATGQSDAGVTLSGGAYTLTGGFWPGINSGQVFIPAVRK